MSDLYRHYGLLVAGGGFAGCAAAISAARHGMDVLLVEETNALGGAPSTCLVNPFMPYWTQKDGKRTLLSGGLFTEIRNGMADLMRELDGPDARVTEPYSIFNEEYLKIVLNRMALDAGVHLLFHTSVLSADTEDGRVTGVTLANSDGTRTVTADYFVDATGDADLSVMSGFSARLGRPGDHLCQPMTLSFRVGEIDVPAFNARKAEMNEAYKRLQAEGIIKNPRENILVFGTTAPHVLHFNTTRVVRRNPVDAADVTAAEIEAREQVIELFTFMKQYAGGFEHARLLSTALNIGVRESRMIDGLYTLTEDDLTSMTHFPDGIACCNYDIDIHNPEGGGTSHWYFPPGGFYTIPYRCLVPRGSKNLLAAGRCVSASHEAQASLRIMPTVCNLGEAAGAAAALAARTACAVDEINTDELRVMLREDGAILE